MNFTSYLHRIVRVGALLPIAILSSVNAGVTPVVIALEGSSIGGSRPTTYTVPAGKTLVLQHISNENSAIPIVSVSVGGMASTLRFKRIGATAATTGSDNLGFEAFDRSVHLPAETIVSPAAGNFLTLFGMLADANDLYVAAGRPVQTTIQSVAKTGDEMSLETKIHPPKPATLTVERSTDLNTFSKDTTAEVTSVSPSRKDVTVDAGGEEKLFVRVRGRTRGGE